MNDSFKYLSDRELLENIYSLLLQCYVEIKEANNTSNQFSINLAADLLGTAIANNKLENGTETNNNR